MPRFRFLTFASAMSGVAIVLGGLPAGAVEFDARGVASFDANAVFSETFTDFEPTTDQRQLADFFEDEVAGETGLHDRGWVRFSSGNRGQPFEVALDLPGENASYRVRLWTRHGRVSARAIFEYTGAREVEVGYLFPTGRVTSDGWTELTSNPVSVTGTELERAFVRLEGSSIDLDAIEVVPEGTYDPGGACTDAFDTSCGPDAVCMSGFCRQGGRFVPPLPAEEYRDSIADYLMGRLQWLSGGHFTRTENLPDSLARMEAMKTAPSAWQYWNAFASGVRRLRDWHTSARSAISIHESERNMSVCFIEGDADLSHGVVPRADGRADLLVSHIIDGANLNMQRGDRLVAVDGMHPIDWARSLIDVNWGFRIADDPDVDADFAEGMRDLIPTFASEFSVIHCDSGTITCDSAPTTYRVGDIPVGGGFGPFCDNRPFYHQKNPPTQFGGSVEDLHFLGFEPWVDELVDSQPGENLWGMTWDSLFGGPNGLTGDLRAANETFKANANGVILDHRTGNGGTVDAPAAVTELVRQPEVLSVSVSFKRIAGFDGPSTPEEGVALFDQLRAIGSSAYFVGSTRADPDLPVALLIHRDGSASDWLVHGLKGAPSVRIFGPHESQGAFSSFYEYGYWSRFSFNLASGDTITRDGTPLIGTGIEPDEIVEHTQTALLEGRDAPYEAALAWIRSQLP